MNTPKRTSGRHLSKLPVYLSLLSCLLATPALHAAGSIVGGQSIEFTTSDFEQSLSASRPWAIYGNADTSSDTPVWSFERMAMDSGRNSSLRPSGSANSDLLSAVTWKITIPETYTITSFTWGIDMLKLENGTGSTNDIVVVQYSFDNMLWTTFENGTYTHKADYADQVLTASVSGGQIVSDLYIRIAGIEIKAEGEAPEADSNYFRIFSNYTNNANAGGVNPATFIELNVALVPELSAVALVLTLATGLALYRRHKTNRSR